MAFSQTAVFFQESVFFFTAADNFRPQGPDGHALAAVLTCVSRPTLSEMPRGPARGGWRAIPEKKSQNVDIINHGSRLN